jgi:putative MATE family efflux protein
MDPAPCIIVILRNRLGDKPKFLYIAVMKRLLQLSFPLVLGNFLETMYNIIDTYFLGQLPDIGREAISATANSWTVFFILIVFGIGFSTASTTLISQAKGNTSAGDDLPNFYLGQSSVLLWFSSIILALAGFLLTPFILQAINTPENIIYLAKDYLQIVFMGLPFMFTIFIFQSSLQAMGDTWTPLLVQATGLLLNIVLDYLLIFGIGIFPAMGVSGAALATTISRGIAATISVFLLLRGWSGLRLRLRYLVPKIAPLKQFLNIGIPAALGHGFSSLGFLVLQSLVNGFGSAAIAAFGIGNRIISIFMMPAMGLARGSAVLIGQHLGAGNKEAAVEVVKTALKVVFVFISVGMLLVMWRGNDVVRFFTSDPEVQSYGANLFLIVSPSVIFFAMFFVTTGAFQGGGYTTPIMILNSTRLWGLRLPLAYLFCIVLQFGPEGIWYSMFLSNLLTAIIGFIVLFQGKWMRTLVMAH